MAVAASSHVLTGRESSEIARSHTDTDRGDRLPGRWVIASPDPTQKTLPQYAMRFGEAAQTASPLPSIYAVTLSQMKNAMNPAGDASPTGIAG
jgi:hypothetical protein